MNVSDRARECSHCGKEYILKKHETGFKYCSDECKSEGYRERRRTNKKKNRINRDKRWSKNGKVDYSISLDKLYKRDKGICYICNEQVDYKDYETTHEGHFIAGDKYPSIDHVIPIAKGGLHRWDNIKLAHRLCNSLKSDKEIEFQMFLDV